MNVSLEPEDLNDECEAKCCNVPQRRQAFLQFDIGIMKSSRLQLFNAPVSSHVPRGSYISETGGGRSVRNQHSSPAGVAMVKVLKGGLLSLSRGHRRVAIETPDLSKAASSSAHLHKDL